MNDSFTPIPSTLLDALIRERLSGSQWRILGWTIRNTLGWQRTSVRFSWYQMARELRMDRAGLLRAARGLLRDGLLVAEGRRLNVQVDPEHWTKPVTKDIGDARHRKRCQPSPVLRRAKERGIETKKYNKESSQTPQSHAAGAARPVPGKYGHLSGERCFQCKTDVPLEWVDPVHCNGKLLAGTGTWRSPLTDGRCPDCDRTVLATTAEKKRQLDLRLRLIKLGGGEKPYRDFRFDSFEAMAANELAFTRARSFNCTRENLYLWGPCGVGKTHLAFATARRFCEEGRSVEFLRPPQLMRRVRLRDPDEEQRAITRLVRTEVFVLDDFGIGHDTAYARQIFQEILDGRDYNYLGGLVVTSKYSLDALAAKLDDDTISSRLAGMCRVTEVGGVDLRLKRRQEYNE